MFDRVKFEACAIYEQLSECQQFTETYFGEKYKTFPVGIVILFLKKIRPFQRICYAAYLHLCCLRAP